MDGEALRRELDGRLNGGLDGREPADGSGVTLLCADCVNPQLAAFALDFARLGCRFGRVVLLSHQRPDVLPAGIDHQPISRLASKDAYNLFCLRDLHRHVETPYCLSLQTDGFPIRPEKFSREFLAHDYNGAPWPANKPYAVQSQVGNSGCCVRSRRFMEATAELATERRLGPHRAHYGQVFDDLFCCWDAYEDLVARGMRFASPSDAARFAVELPTEHGKGLDACYAYHGSWQVPTRWLKERLDTWKRKVVKR